MYIPLATPPAVGGGPTRDRQTTTTTRSLDVLPHSNVGRDFSANAFPTDLVMSFVPCIYLLNLRFCLLNCGLSESQCPRQLIISVRWDPVVFVPPAPTTAPRHTRGRNLPRGGLGIVLPELRRTPCSL